MIELPLVFVAGILGTAHCLGMCGPFALIIGGGSKSWSDAVARQLAYTAGRVFTYAVLGAAAGYCGSHLVAVLPSFLNFPAALAIAAGLLLLWQGFRATGLWPSRLVSRWWNSAASNGIGAARDRLPRSAAPCLAGGFLGQFLRSRGTGVFLAGMFTGLLPCGLLYGMLALAASTHSLPFGGLAMAIFGLGTAPGMILTGLSGRIIGPAVRRRILTAAAWCLMLAGLVSVVRGVSFLSTDRHLPASCPMCLTGRPMDGVR